MRKFANLFMNKIANIYKIITQGNQEKMIICDLDDTLWRGAANLGNIFDLGSQFTRMTAKSSNVSALLGKFSRNELMFPQHRFCCTELIWRVAEKYSSTPTLFTTFFEPNFSYLDDLQDRYSTRQAKDEPPVSFKNFSKVEVFV